MQQAHKRRLTCYECKKLCEVDIPCTGTKPVRYLIRCPNCGKLNENDPDGVRAKKSSDSQVSKTPPADRKQSTIKEKTKALPPDITSVKKCKDGAKVGSTTTRVTEETKVNEKPGKEMGIELPKRESERDRLRSKRNSNVDLRTETHKAEEVVKKMKTKTLAEALEAKSEEVAPPLVKTRSSSSGHATSNGEASCSTHPGSTRSRESSTSTRGADEGPSSSQLNGGDLCSKTNSKQVVKGSRSSTRKTAGNPEDDLDGFLIEESTARIAARPLREKTTKTKVEIIPRLGGVPPPSKTVDKVALSALPTCAQAYEAAQVKPRWHVGDEVEVAWKGKGFEGSWASATVVLLDGKKHVLVRFREFVDTDGSPLVENMGIERLRLPPPPTETGWMPAIGEQIEGLWNDVWWEGTVRELHYLKGVLFQYDRYANWLWLPLRCIRPRPRHETFYPHRPLPDGEADEEEEEEEGVPPGSCGVQGCKLPNNHHGLCQVRIEGSRRAKLQETTEMQRQTQLWNEIKRDRRISQQMAVARAETLKKAEEAGVSIRASKGNRAQWHANFKLDEFDQPFYYARDLCVIQEDMQTGERDLRGLLVIGHGHTLADTYQMLMTEHQLCPVDYWHLVCVHPHGETIVDLFNRDPQSDMMELLPEVECDLLDDKFDHASSKLGRWKLDINVHVIGHGNQPLTHGQRKMLDLQTGYEVRATTTLTTTY